MPTDLGGVAVVESGGPFTAHLTLDIHSVKWQSLVMSYGMATTLRAYGSGMGDGASCMNPKFKGKSKIVRRAIIEETKTRQASARAKKRAVPEGDFVKPALRRFSWE